MVILFKFRLTASRVRKLLLVALNSAYEIPDEMITEDELIKILVENDEEDDSDTVV